MKPNRIFQAVIIALFTADVTRAGTTYYVDVSCPSAGDGTHSACGANGPKTNIQAGLNLAHTGDTVIVIPGTYTSNNSHCDLSQGGSGNCQIQFPRDVNNTAYHVTLICADASGRPRARECIIDAAGAIDTRHRAFLFNGDKATREVIVDGFYVKNCAAESGNEGGAVNISDSEPWIRNCTFYNNQASLSGGAIYILGTNSDNPSRSPLIESCVIDSNEAGVDGTANGGGIAIHQHADTDIKNCVITNNTATYGGGINWTAGSDVQVTDTLIEGNRADVNGGGIRAESKESPTRLSWIKRSIIRRNTAAAGIGGGIAIVDSGPEHYGGFLQMVIVNTQFLGNTAADTSVGGGVAITGISTPNPNEFGLSVVNSVFVGNTAGDGAAIYITDDPAVKIQDSSFSQNIAQTDGAAIRWANINDVSGLQPVKVHNSIVYDNGPAELSESISEKLDVQYSNIQGGWVYGSNIATGNPLFTLTPDPGLDGTWGTYDDHFGNLRPYSSLSSCVNHGSNSLIPADDADIDDDCAPGVYSGSCVTESLPLDVDMAAVAEIFARISGSTVDIGAYELDNCTEDSDCYDYNDCNGIEECAWGHCLRKFEDCNLNGVQDYCDLVYGTSVDCDLDGRPDDEICQPGVQDAVLIFGIPSFSIPGGAASGSLWRSHNNVVYLTFACPVTVPSSGQILIEELISGAGNYGDDKSGNFSLSSVGVCVGGSGSGNPCSGDGDCPGSICGNFGATVKIKDGSSTSSLEHRKWYGIRNIGDWEHVAEFEVQYLVQMGDANNDRKVQTSDASLLYAHFGAQSEWSRYDIDGDRDTDSGDTSIVYSHVPSLDVSKPGGH